MKKIETEEWFALGIKILNTGSFEKIIIQHLCDEMDVTKGAFYYYFKSIDDYIDRLMQYWTKKYSDEFIKEAERMPNIGQRKQSMTRKLLNPKHRNEQVIRSWAFCNSTVKKYLDKVDLFRLEYFVNLRILLGEDPQSARKSSIAELSAIIGLQGLRHLLQREDVAYFFEESTYSTPTIIRKRN